MLTNEQINIIKDLVINHLEVSYNIDIPEEEIINRTGIVDYSVIRVEVLLPLEKEEYIISSGSNFISAKLTEKGAEIKRKGGWISYLQELEKERLEENEKNNEYSENIRWNTKLTKKQVKNFRLSMFVGVVGGLCGLLALSLQIKEMIQDNNTINNNNAPQKILMKQVIQQQLDTLRTTSLDSSIIISH